MLSEQQLAAIRRLFRASRPNHAGLRAEVNAAAQAAVNSFQNECRPLLAAAIESAAPGKFTAADKVQLVMSIILERVF